MSHILPNSEEVGCTQIQAQRVWEIWNDECENKSTHNIAVDEGGRYIVVRDSKNDRTFLVFPNGDVFLRNATTYPNPPPPVPTQPAKHNVEYCKGLATAIEMAWKVRFRTQDLDPSALSIVAQRGEEAKLRILLDRILDREKGYDFLVSLLQGLKKGAEKPVEEKYGDGYRRGKISAIRLVWQARFESEMPHEYRTTLDEAYRRQADSVDMFLRRLVVISQSTAIEEMAVLDALNKRYPRE
jgi:hypothetical protein